MSDAQDYKLVSSVEERNEVFQDLLQAAPPVMGLAADNVIFRLKPLRLEAGFLYLELEGVSNRALLASEPLTLIFGLGSGQYYIHGKMALRSANLYAVKTETDLHRLQRRSSFRAVVHSSYPVEFRCTDLNGSSLQFSYTVYDISASGISLYLTSDKAPKLKAGDRLRGTLTFPDGTVETTGEVRHIFPPEEGGGYKAGVKLLHLSHADQQFLFTASLKIHRLTAAHFLR